MKPISIINELNESYKYGSMTDDQFIHILDVLNLSRSNTSGGTIRFNNVDIDKIKKLLSEKLIDPRDRQNYAPSIGEMIDFSEKEGISNVTVDGYVVVPDRSDSRVSIDGLNFDFDESLIDEVNELLQDADERKIESNHAEGWWD